MTTYTYLRTGNGRDYACSQCRHAMSAHTPTGCSLCGCPVRLDRQRFVATVELDGPRSGRTHLHSD